ncbi:MAG: DUF523 domain-containing protein [Candidatus Omnitrophota bacterium]
MASRINKPILVSACLAGIDCTYRGRNKLVPSIKKMVDDGIAIPVCPEVMGGMGIPRENSEIVGGGGMDVLMKRARVITISGKDVTKIYIKGAKAVLAIAGIFGVRKAILKSKSPACGAGRIYDGSFTKKLKNGSGVTASLLCQKGVKVYSA